MILTRTFCYVESSCGFWIIDEPSQLAVAECINNKSTTCSGIRERVENQLTDEISKGHYGVTIYKPIIISVIGAISNSDGSSIFRLITDCSRSHG